MRNVIKCCLFYSLSCFNQASAYFISNIVSNTSNFIYAFRPQISFEYDNRWKISKLAVSQFSREDQQASSSVNNNNTFCTHLRVDADDLIALFARVGEHLFVALDAVGVVVAQHVSLPGEGVVAVPATEMAIVPVFGHCLRVFPAENQLYTQGRLDT